MTKNKWNKIRGSFRSVDDWSQLQLNDGVSDQELDALEKVIGNRLPDSFREFYKVHNGQNDSSATGLVFGVQLLPTSKITEQWNAWLDAAGYNEEFAEEMKSEPEGYIRKQYTNPGWIPFTYDYSGNHLGIDLDPDSKGTAGQVIAFGRDEDTKILVAGSFAEFLDRFIVNLNDQEWEISSDGEWVFRNSELDGLPYQYWANGSLPGEGEEETDHQTFFCFHRPKVLQRILNELREVLKAAQTRPEELPRYVACPPDSTITREPDLEKRIYDSQPTLLQEGQLVWGHLYKAGAASWQEGASNELISVIYSKDGLADKKPAYLANLQDNLTAVAIDHEEERYLLYKKVVTDDFRHQLTVKVPEPLDSKLRGQLNSWIATTVLIREHLPQGYLSNGLLPLLICPEKTPATMILPFELWTPEQQYLFSGELDKIAPEE